MSNRFRYVIDVECERTEGKFASRDEIGEQIEQMLNDANYGTIDGIGADGTSSYEIVDWSVSEEPIEKPKRINGHKYGGKS